MIISNLLDFKKNLTNYLNLISETSEVVLIERGKKAPLVILPLEDYNALVASQEQLAKNKIKAKFDSGIQKFDVGKN
jgi:PHD/YefM family antitoxin component YafN of YafNO toxin-antitoxin module